MKIGAQPNAMDPRSLDDVKRLARDGNSPEAIKAAAKQFEALFLQQVMKSMRDTVPQEGMFNNEQTKTYQSMLDQQMASVIADGRGLGLAEQLSQQLMQRQKGEQALRDATPKAYPLGDAAQRHLKNGTSQPVSQGLPLTPSSAGISLQPPPPLRIKPLTPRAVPAVTDAPQPVNPDLPPASQDFVTRMWEGAVEASRQTGIPAQFMVGQAALETGWGKGEIRTSSGAPSYNVFNIKAGKNWTGPTVEVATTEYVNGQPQREVARFRAYGSYAEAFRDYAALIAGNPRYADVLNQVDSAGFARSLQAAGYATDPQYASKLERVIAMLASRQSSVG